MPTTYKFISLIMCDDARREDNGKEILIGTYPGALIVNVVPFVMPSFALRFEIIPLRYEYRKIVVLMKNPKSEDVFRIEGALAVSQPNVRASFFFRASPVMVAMTGEHTIWMGMDEEAEEVGTLAIFQGPPPQLPPPPAIS